MLEGLAIASAVMLVAVWLLYPGTMALLASVRRRIPSVSEQAPPTVTVVIATREPAEVVRARIENCLDTDYPTELLSIILACDAGSASSVVELDLPGAPVTIVAADPPGGKGGALNAGVRAATGSVIVFADAHQRFRRDTIPRLIAALSDPRMGGVSGRLELPRRRASLVAAYWSMERRLRRNEAVVHSAVGATGAVWAVRREVWKPLPAGVLLDDVYAPMMVVLGGRRIAYAPDAVAIETRDTTPGQEFRRKVRTLTGVIQLCVWLPAVLSPLKNPIWPQFVFHKLLRMLTPYCAAFIVIWAFVRGLPLLGKSAPVFLAAAGLAVVWLVRTRTRTGSRIRQLAVEGTLLQAAVIVAGVNGMRRHWQVWNS
jgi:cellulose synthase/poly-beta-1,6-N-acetylglucosamine synthase-like glycosyltransferase